MLKFGHNITSLQSIMHANLGGRRLRDIDLGTLKPRKNCFFWAEIFFISLLTQKTLKVERWNLDTTWVEIESVCVPSLRASSHVTEISEAKKGQKVVKFEVVYLGK